MSVLIFFIILAVLVLSHEFGHFIVAKISGVRVDEFGFGFPPKIFGIKFGETTYTLNLLPFGGFVKIFGEDGEDMGSDATRSFLNQSKKVQAMIVVAGVVFNLILAWFLFSVGFMTGLPVPLGSMPAGTVLENQKLLITGVLKDSPASKAGLLVGDEIILLSMDDGQKIQSPTVSDVQEFIQNAKDKKISFVYKRGEEPIKETFVTPKIGLVPDKPVIGISMDMVGNLKLSILGAIYNGGWMTVNVFIATILGFANLIYMLFSGQSALESVAGPVGLVSIISDAYGFGFIYLVGLTALISVNLAVLNLIPFPALDGGRLFIILIEAIKGSSINSKAVGIVNATGFLILLVLMLFITYFDVLKILGS